MKVKDVQYIGSYVSRLPRPAGPEFLFVGRSNVGKSSLINHLVGRRNIARTSNTPGKTRTANFYAVNKAFAFVDVPGYGYAKVSKAERRRWTEIIAAYISEREVLRGVVHVLDARHEPSVEDRRMSKALFDSGKPVCIVFTKIDKLGGRDVDGKIGSHLRALTADPATAVVPFSAESGAGRRALWSWLQERLSL